MNVKLINGTHSKTRTFAATLFLEKFTLTA